MRTASQASSPTASSPAALARMRGQARRDTAPEVELRRRLYASGLRYRVGFRPLPAMRRTADVAFPRQRVAVFVDGCFWHQCPDHGTRPRANAEFWDSKLARNVARDRETDAALGKAGWVVVRVWEHEDAAAAALRVRDAVLNSK